MSQPTQDDRTHMVARVIDAPLADIYEALTDPERLVQWLPPDEATHGWHTIVLNSVQAAA